MATAESVKEKIENLLYSANFITKENDTTLVDAMLRLMGGYNAADAVNAAVKVYGVDPTAERISAGDFVQIIHSWGLTSVLVNEESKWVAVVPLSESKAVAVTALESSFAVTASLWATLLSADGLEARAVSNVYVGAAFEPPLETLEPAAVALNDSTVLVVWKHAFDSRHGAAQVLTVSGDTISLGEEICFYPNEIGNQMSVIALTSNKALVVYSDSNGYGYATALTVEGTTVTAGTATNFGNSVRTPKVVALTDSKALVVYNTSNGYGYAIVLECPGTTVTKGSAYNFRSASTSDMALTPLDQRRALLAYRDAATTGYLYATILQVTDASVTTTNSPTLQLTDYGGNKPEVTRVDTDKVLVVANFGLSDSSSEIRAHVLTVGESKITKGAALVLKSVSTREEARAVATLPNGAALAVIGNVGMSDVKNSVFFGLDINGTTVSRQLLSGTSVVPLTTTKYPIGVAKTSGVPGDVLFVYRAGEPATE